jgi:hypothetical protein
MREAEIGSQGKRRTINPGGFRHQGQNLNHTPTPALTA